MEHTTFEKGIFTTGASVQSMLSGFGSFKTSALRMMAEEGIGEKNSAGEWEISSEKWYSTEAFLRVFKKIADKLGAAQLKAIGYKVPENAVFPPWVKDIHSAIQSIDIAFHLNHSRDGKNPMFDINTGVMQEGIGHYGYEPVEGEKKIICVCSNPYQSAFDQGIIECMATKFEPTARVSIDESKPMRSKGASSDTFVITWM
ncbi:hypothetical protein CH379_013535 [Leptospira ellisii]|uniref:Uncharacterized protein n=1 Tax=Leptospira ellisii TaxID=2023197 RepID=A0A2N0BFS2_9LEPT|nr:hypothetical protein [Leptospira ellisii]MDV6236647.1 hypothetical protein [Leptospira ellisii]PJZ92825.1 hypothetical protein CH379_11075 [Leptospira ellisii]PKA02851.1 hypothetical protein CH375_20505 [Leptospira ellisii]